MDTHSLHRRARPVGKMTGQLRRHAQPYLILSVVESDGEDEMKEGQISSRERLELQKKYEEYGS